MDKESSSPQSIASEEISWKILIGVMWVVTLLITGVGGYMYGRGSSPTSHTDKVVLGSTSQPDATPTVSAPQSAFLDSPTISPTITTVINTAFCKKTGFAQKWEYLTSYTIKSNDTYQDIAKEQLHDSSRVNEITQINGTAQMVVGSTLYLPPVEVTKSSGNLKEVYGKIMEQNSVSWHISFSSDPKGQGILLPSFWFEGVPQSNAYKIGDCVKIFFDDGYKIYSITSQ